MLVIHKQSSSEQAPTKTTNNLLKCFSVLPTEQKKKKE